MSQPIKTILVSLNNSKFLKSNLAMAKKIAQKYDSHIIGLYVIPSAFVYATPHGYGGPYNFTAHNEFYRSKASSVENDFRNYIQKEGLNAEWRQVKSLGHFVDETIVEHGREADLVIMGDDSSVQSNLHYQSQIIQALGRPILFVPNKNTSEFRFGKAILTWNGSRESARAAFDAIPILQLCNTVEVTCFNAHKERNMLGDIPGAGLATSLARYDIEAKLVLEKTRTSISKAIIDRAKTADLLIMGAYGHSRLRETILGGVTNKVLSDIPCPVLMCS